MKILVLVILLVFGLIALADPPAGGPAANTPTTPATGYHGLPGNNGGHSGETNGACPATTGNGQCNGGIHNIGGGAPGQNGGHADDRPPACTMHGGLNAANRNC